MTIASKTVEQNVLLYGPPGTGKSNVAGLLSFAIMGLPNVIVQKANLNNHLSGSFRGLWFGLI